jgi:hypothetical protein
MVRLQHVPYLQAALDSVTPGEWWLRQDNLNDHLPDVLPDWEPTQTLHLLRTLEIDLESVRRDCQLEPGETVRVAAVWRCNTTGLRGAGTRVDLAGSDRSTRVELNVLLQGSDLGGTLELETQLVLPHRVDTRHGLAPARAGSVLWNDVYRVELGGSSGRFPMELVDFEASAWLPPRAGWFLDWDPDDLDRPLLGELRLLVNEKHEAVLRAVTVPKPLLPERVVRDEIRCDVARTLIIGALQNEQFVADNSQFEDASVGAAIRGMIAVWFPTDTVEGLAQYWKSRPREFETYIQHSLRLFEGMQV